METQDSKNQTKSPPGKLPLPFLTQENLIIIYTMMAVIQKMRARLGLEAMLQYIDCYMAQIGQHNPCLKDAVEQVLQLIEVEKLYRDMCVDEKRK
jgi:hypothetical protein